MPRLSGGTQRPVWGRRNRQRKAEARRERHAEIRALLEAKAAKTIGLTLPSSLLLQRTDQVIE